MAHITTGVEYGLHSLLYLVGSDDEEAPPLSTRDLAELQGVPAEYVAKLFTKLQKAGLVAATEGARGGFRLARGAGAISVLDVITAIDGDKSLFECRDIRGRCAVFGGKPKTWATRGVCSIHAIMLEAEARMRAVLAERTLADIAASVTAKTPPEFAEAVTKWLADRAPPRRRGRPASP
ncbi:RrF2 family transcriptional regulator [Phreatobacter stygius]|uniref:Rrf2 family transcriptional regulator n=1 Tax=Phreatobacter stygius TaxID=1940610 RepID=A0A4D7B215_9HYPH|nr:Rrf2 family transcriptional regulator [Phreatobacter stygius]QCI67624.1 Rrf2 family transcriptional regulator [Phreatobacter stygius]